MQQPREGISCSEIHLGIATSFTRGWRGFIVAFIDEVYSSRSERVCVCTLWIQSNSHEFRVPVIRLRRVPQRASNTSACLLAAIGVGLLRLKNYLKSGLFSKSCYSSSRQGPASLRGTGGGSLILKVARGSRVRTVRAWRGQDLLLATIEGNELHLLLAS